MILEGYSMQGSMHKMYGVVNQDSFRTEEIDHDIIGIVCDGVSLKSDRTFSDSQIASRFVSDSIARYLKENLKRSMSDQERLVALYDALSYGDGALTQMLKERNIPLFDCQTTALVFIYHKGRICAAMAGDGGILYETKDGEFGILQTRIKTSPTVDPICDRQSWRFGAAGSKGNPVYRLLIATDGVFDSIAQMTSEGMALNAEILESLFDLSKVKKNYRQAAFKKIIEDIPSHDDKTAILLIEGKNSPDLHF